MSRVMSLLLVPPVHHAVQARYRASAVMGPRRLPLFSPRYWWR